MSAFLDTELDPRDDDRSIALAPDEQLAELRTHFESLSHRDRLRYWRDATDGERDDLARSYGLGPVAEAVPAIVAAIGAVGVATVRRHGKAASAAD